MDERDAKNSQNTRRVPVVRDGVGYTPSGADDFDYDFDPSASGNIGSAPDENNDQDQGQDLGKTRKITPAPPRGGIPGRNPRPTPVAPRPGSAAQKQKRAPAPKKAHYAVLLVTTVFISVIAVVFVFTMVFNQWTPGEGGFGWSFDLFSRNTEEDQPERPRQPEPDEEIDQPPLTLPPGSVSFKGLLLETNPVSGRMDVYVMEDSLIRTLFVENYSALRDRFGNAITFTEFRVGDVVEIAYEEGSTVVETARVSAEVRRFSNIRDVVVNTETNELLIGNNRYIFNTRTVVMYHGETDSIADVSTVDLVTVDTFRDRNGIDRVVFVDIHQGSGIIHIPENNMIIHGRVEIANTTFTALEGEMEIRVPEGDHRVIVRGDNIEDFQYELTVARGGSATVDFEELELLAGSLTVNVADPYVNLTIDGEIHLTNSMIILDYGTYLVSVTREGFVPFEQEITIDSANHEITVALEEIIHTQNVTLITSPAGARMYLDGQYVGLSPVSIELELRRYSVTMALQGFVGGTSDIWVTEERPVFSWSLQADPGFVPVSPTPTPTPALYPEVSPAPSPSPSPFFNR
jgi:hypothetical protein